ncbi:MAG: HmuY family protein, partial [Deltaproteobacteria bacterium]|nr:HmuY family protein [Deltaproteobacteria bacterium]
SMDWDVGLRRYLIRINSGNSGPSCVVAAPVPGSADYDSLAQVPEGLSYQNDVYFDESCQLIPDNSGLGSAATAICEYWKYTGCVKVTGKVYVLQLASGRRLKLTVTHYYNPPAQEQCQKEDKVPQQGSGAANFQVRWAWL